MSATLCPICLFSFDLESHRPKKLQCSHSLCSSCCIEIGDPGQLKCPSCDRTEPFNDINEVQDDQELVAILSRSVMRCMFHEDAQVLKFCLTHFVPICDQCVQICARCHVVDCIPWQVRKPILDHLQAIISTNSEISLPEDLREEYHSVISVISEEIPIVTLLDVFRRVIRCLFPVVCQRCVSEGCEFIDTQTVELLCRRCWASHQSEWIIEVSYEEEMRARVRFTVWTWLKRINAYQLNLEEVIWLHSQNIALKEFVKGARNLLRIPVLACNFPEYFFCPMCGGYCSRQSFRLRLLPCRGASHFICEPCASSSNSPLLCHLDHSEYYIRGLDLEAYQYSEHSETERDSRTYDPVNRLYTGSIAPPQVIRSAIIGEGHILCDKGIPLPPFQSHRPELLTLERYPRVLPDPDIALESCPFTVPWYVNQHKSQVEALSFSCFREAALWGLGLANPVEYGVEVRVLWVRMYEGKRGSGAYMECELVNNRLVGGNSVVTDIFFHTSFLMQSKAVYTLKLKLESTPPGIKIPIYHGNHIGRKIDPVGEDQTAWEYVQTTGVEQGEKCNGQHDLISPILRLIYT